MPSFIRGLEYLFHNQAQFADSIVKNFFRWLPDKLYLQLRFRFCMGNWPNFKNPKTFCEKLQWLKIYNRRPEYTTMVDKYAVKQYVADKLGQKYVVPLLGVWDNPEDIDWDSLPNQFVLKTTHGGGNCGVVICKNKKTFDKMAAIEKLRSSLHEDIYDLYREWPYKNVRKRIIAEQFLSLPAYDTISISDDLPDYKFYCFDGEPKFCQVIRDRRTQETIDFYDMDWTHQNFCGLNSVARNGSVPVARPKNLEEMIKVCKILAASIPFVRVDLYLVGERLYFGELTFFPATGIGTFTPEIWNTRIGDMVQLPCEQ